jgi:hypothetical protein
MSMRLARACWVHPVDGEAGAGGIAAGEALHPCRGCATGHSGRREQMINPRRAQRAGKRALQAQIRVPDLQPFLEAGTTERHPIPTCSSITRWRQGQGTYRADPGGSSGIGKAAAQKIAAAGAKVLSVRGADELEATRKEWRRRRRLSQLRRRFHLTRRHANWCEGICECKSVDI